MGELTYAEYVYSSVICMVMEYMQRTYKGRVGG